MKKSRFSSRHFELCRNLDLKNLAKARMRTGMNEKIPAEVFPPGDFLRDELEARGWSQSEFAEIIGRPIKTVNEIIAGKRRITPTTAKELEAALDISARSWMNHETIYQLHNVQPAPDRIRKEAKIRS
jgi:HTH-type transcriptional regulator / antitoxin HigA